MKPEAPLDRDFPSIASTGFPRAQGEQPASASNKLLIFAVVLLAAESGYLAVDHFTRAPAPTSQQAAPQPSPATPSPAPAPASPPSAAAAANAGPDETQAYTDCVSGLFPTQADARSRAAACSKAL
jgi:hypothetical protein